MQASRRNRRRLPRSCEECRRRKVKCDRNHPCSHCVMTKCHCLYNKGSHPLASHPEQSSPKTLAQNSHLSYRQAADTGSELNLDSHLPLGSGPCPAMRPSAMTESNPVNPMLSRPSDSYQATRSERTNPTERTLSQDPLFVQNGPVSGTDTSPPLFSPIRSCPRQANNTISEKLLVLNKSRLFGKTHWTNAVYEFQRISTFMRNETISSAEQRVVYPLTAEIRALLQQCKHLSQNMKILRPGRFLSCPGPIVSSPDMADHLVHLYLSHMEPIFRILHRPSFRNEYERSKVAPADTSDATMLKIQLAIAIGSGLCPDLSGAKNTHRAAYQWVYAAQDWLSGPMEKNRLSMDGIQVHCLLILARQVLSVSGDLSWVAMGTLLRTALQLGLHRDPKNFPGMSIFEAEMRRRIWATILELNAQASLDSGTLPGISNDDFDTGLPANINDEDIDEDSTILKQYDGTTKTDTSLQRFLLQSLPPRLEMLRMMNGLGTNLGDEKTLALSTKFSEACREVDAHVRANPDGQTATFNRNIASLLVRRFLLVLHRPLAGRIRENALYYHSRKVSFDSAMALLNPPSSNEAFTYLMLRGGGLFKSCMVHASLALGSELLIETEEQGSSTYRQMLIDAVKEARQQWVQRIQLGDTNVRIHMKLCIVLNLAEVTGGEESQTQQQRMAQSAKDSLELCHGLIRENFAASTATSSSGCDEWSGQSPHLERDNEQSSLSSYSISLGDILQINGSDMDGDFELVCIHFFTMSDIPTHYRALVLNRVGGDMQIEQRPMPKADPGNVVVRVLESAVLSYQSDIYDGTRQYPLTTPIVGGCSAVGRVVATGPDATIVTPGQLVWVDCVVHGRDDPDAIYLWGIHDGSSPSSQKLSREVWHDGTFAEFAKVPLENCIPLNEERLYRELKYTPHELIHLFHLLVPFGGLRTIDLKAGETVIVCPSTGGFSGAGVQVALAMGARVIAMGRNEKELARLKALVMKGTPWANIETVKVTGDQAADTASLKAFGTIDAILDISPPAAAKGTHLPSAMAALRRGGRISVMGSVDQPIVGWNFLSHDLMLKGKLMYEREDLLLFVKMLEAGLFAKGRDLVETKSFALEDWKEAFREASEYTAFARTVSFTL
ncbi:hypothetical protein F5Y01DRAFT_301852 [Xylaria sp. FL0043]|nr:hypothetical protein F5Y01DRAFT_301852 [Xylaria sp. FL0043]